MDELIKEFGEVISEIESSYNDLEYNICEENVKKCERIIELFNILAKVNNGKIVTKRFIPHEVNGYIEAEFKSLYLEGSYLDCFKEIIHLSGAVSIDPLLNGKICVSVMVENVFEK